MSEAKHPSSGKDFWASLMLAHTPGLGPTGCKRLLEYYGTAEHAAHSVDDWPSRAIAERNVADNFRQEKWREGAENEWELALKGNMAVITYSDPRYPDRLRHISDPPLYLYYTGNAELFHAPCIAVVGSRNYSAQGAEITGEICRKLSSRGIGVVSGFAWGIDRVAHKSALAEKGGTAAVLGTGLDLIYPSRNEDLWQSMRSNGLILTEFGPGTRPEAHHFPRRNRIISGLCLGVLVAEATKNSGSLITAQYALEQNREVFAVPGSPKQRSFAGCNDLIKRGAVLARSAEDIFREIEPMLEEWISGPEQTEPESDESRDAAPEIPDLSDQEQELIQAMSPGNPVHIDSLTRNLDWSSSSTSQTLLGLELKGVVSRQDGMHYTLLR